MDVHESEMPEDDANSGFLPDKTGLMEDMSDQLHRMLIRSSELDMALTSHLATCELDPSLRAGATLAMCTVALEHAAGLRTLVERGRMTSAVALMRLQYEALARAMWLLYVAPESAIEKTMAPLDVKSEQMAESLPSVAKMLEQIRSEVGRRVPAGASEMLDSFKDVHWRPLNSYVHSGLHSLRRSWDGYPEPLILDVLRNSNALVTMTGMVLALLASESAARAMRRVQLEFADCLPPLLGREQR